MKNKILFGLLILGTLLLFGCTQGNRNQFTGRTPTTSSGTIDLQACVAKCTGSSAIWRMGCKVECYSNKAIETKNPKVCEPLITDADSGISPYEVCLANLGKEIKNAEVCKDLQSRSIIQYEICVDNIARKVKDPTMCNLIQPGSITYDSCIKGSRSSE